MKSIVFVAVLLVNLLQASITVDGNPKVVKKSGDLVFIVTDNKIEVIDVKDINDPKNLSSVVLKSTPISITINESNFYLVASDGLYIYSINENHSLNLEGIFETTYAKKVFVKDNVAYIANYMDGLQVVDISDKTKPILKKFYEYKTTNDVFVKNNIAFLSNKNKGLIVLDISNKIPKEIATFMVKDFTSMEQKDNNLYFSNQYKGMYVVDISDPNNPKYKKQLHTKATDISLSSKNAFLVNKDLDLLEFVDITVPELPSVINYKEFDGLSSIDNDENYVYALDSKGLKIFDLSGKTIYDKETTISASKNSLTKTLNKGWNLIGNPTINQFNTSNLKNTLIKWSYSNGEWIKNPSMIESNKGFWIYNKNIEVIEFLGDREIVDVSNIESGWNILSTGVDINNLNSNKSILISWIYEKGKWTHNPTVIKAGTGFWVYKK